VEDREEDRGEIRLVAWVRSLVGGQKLDPKPDRHRGFTAIVVHLRQGPPPSPDGPRYNLLAHGPEHDANGFEPVTEPPPGPRRPGRRRLGPVPVAPQIRIVPGPR
jgi:hypothetical protein